MENGQIIQREKIIERGQIIQKCIRVVVKSITIGIEHTNKLWTSVSAANS